MPDSPASHHAVSWRAPVTTGIESVAAAAAGIVVAVVFFPLWIAIPVAVLLGAWGLGMAARRPAVVLDPRNGQLTVTLGILTRRIRLADISVVQLDRAKVTFGQADGTAVSVHAWRRGRLDAWLRIPDVSGDMAHAVSRAASAACPREEETRAGAKIRSGKNLPSVVVTVAGVIEIAAVFFVRVSWPGPVMTALGALVALGFGFTGVFSVVFAFWTHLTARPRGATSAIRPRPASRARG